ncbi:Protein kinase domain-containing protein [Aphelenchoides besseyi]|nr:Protein kinase domain-containing protein [Aphelenchoides besseyi]
MKRSQPSDFKNLLNYYDYGGVGGTCNFLFLPLLGASLKELLETKTPTYCTSIQLSIQTLRSIRSFHKLGRIHRDIKPSNFVQGREDDTNTIYLIDFGWRFIGTKVYASCATHKRKPQTRRDDMESWFFVVSSNTEYFHSDYRRGGSDTGNVRSRDFVVAESRYLENSVDERYLVRASSTSRLRQTAGLFRIVCANDRPHRRLLDFEFFLNMLTTHAKERELDLDAPFE